jgi:phenylpyruvate tautomerase PptA (4-oxalocrotonate tautomerase family)
MAQIKIYGQKAHIKSLREELSNIIHSCIVEALSLPKEKRFHRFFAMDKEDFIYPNSRSNSYIIIEIIMIKGRSKEAKRELIKLLFKSLKELLNIESEDIEITIFEIEASNFAFRGVCADEAKLNYKIGV